MSFRLKTILGIALIELALLSLLLWSGLGFMISSAETEFRQRTQATARAFAVAAKDSLISSDLAALSALTREMLDYPGVAYARVRDAQGRIVAQAGPAAALARLPRDRPAALDALDDGVFDALSDISEAGTGFGRIELGVSATDLQRQLAEARRFGIGLAALEMLLVALFSWLLGAYLTRQLRDLSEASGRLARGALGLQIPVRGSDELGTTAQAFNRMSDSLARSYAELATREQDLRLRGRIIEATAVGTVIADATRPDLPVVDVNPAFERITGYTLDEVRGRNCRFLQGPATDAQALGRIRAALAAGTEVNELLLNYRRDGTLFWNELQIMPIRDDAGALTHFVALQSDVSERVQAQQALAAREAYLRQVLNTTHDGIVVIDEHGIVESFNAGAEAMFGHRADEVIGRDVALILPSPHREQHATRLRRPPQQGRDRVRREVLPRGVDVERGDALRARHPLRRAAGLRGDEPSAGDRGDPLVTRDEAVERDPLRDRGRRPRPGRRHELSGPLHVVVLGERGEQVGARVPRVAVRQRGHGPRDPARLAPRRRDDAQIAARGAGRQHRRPRLRAAVEERDPGAVRGRRERVDHALVDPPAEAGSLVPAVALGARGAGEPERERAERGAPHCATARSPLGAAGSIHSASCDLARST